MLSSGFLFLLSAAYVVTLFGVAFWGDRRARQRGNPVRKRWTYSLALAVYCTSWTFYGAVGRAAVSGWDFLPIYLGPALVFVFGHGLIARLMYTSLYKMHQVSIHGFVRVAFDTVGRLLRGRLLTPRRFR